LGDLGCGIKRVGVPTSVIHIPLEHGRFSPAASGTSEGSGAMEWHLGWHWASGCPQGGSFIKDPVAAGPPPGKGDLVLRGH
jgi:hypothetical protein